MRPNRAHIRGDQVVRPAGLSLAEVFEWWMPGLVPPITECWEWPGARLPKGYGYFGFEGKKVYAHVAAHRLFVGPVQEGDVVRHRCNNPPCVHPAHVTNGTYADNSADMVLAGRQARGEELPQARLTEMNVLDIRSRSGVSQSQIAKEYGVSLSLIQAIRAGKVWKHVDMMARSQDIR